LGVVQVASLYFPVPAGTSPHVTAVSSAADALVAANAHSDSAQSARAPRIELRFILISPYVVLFSAVVARIHSDEVDWPLEIRIAA
jgi:hypothetical protein